MTKADWMNKIKSNLESLKSLVAEYHPTRAHPPRHNLEITAPHVEAARQQAVKAMLLAGECQANPVKRFEVAVATEDLAELYSILNRTWIGVPESTSCWSIRGFKEAVDLLEDPPEMEDPGEEA